MPLGIADQVFADVERFLADLVDPAVRNSTAGGAERILMLFGVLGELRGCRTVGAGVRGVTGGRPGVLSGLGGIVEVLLLTVDLRR
ncbi:hypothetical protein GCM10010532_069140 [Dactylosporangium siamense]|uniref:Uncharacterized protein n=1 Tax=Dactylosporangium siamense TaxID=685454 RepID=A0A919PQP4_9ACTN|nr:hypothetical protein Dsi01nite_047860 [Dactylosporangium siamense]